MKNFNKRYKKKLISLILALVIVLTALPINALAVADSSLELPPDSENQEVTETTLEIPEDIPEDAGNEPPPENEIPDEPPTIEPKFIIPKASVKFVGFEDYPIDGIFVAVKIALKANDVPIDIGEIAINQTELVFNEKPEAEGDVPITYTFALDSNTNADVTVEIVGSEITITYVKPVVEEELPTEGEVTPPEGEEESPEGEEVPTDGEVTPPEGQEVQPEGEEVPPMDEKAKEELRNQMGDNPDNLDGPIYVEGSGLNYLPGSLSTASMGTRFLAEKSPTVPGGVELIKTVEEIDGLLNTFKVTLRVEALDEQKYNDIVLVIDTSGSMAGARLFNTKVAATQFVNELLNESHPLTRIALVSFAGGAVERKGFVNYTGKEDLKNAINALSATGGTHTQAGIHMARTLLNGSPADIKQIVLLSDGEPTYSYGMTNPDNYLEPRPGGGGGQRTNTLSPETNYQYNNTVGNGSTIETQYNWRQNRYYHHGNSAIAEAGFAKTAGYTVHTIAMGAGPTGTPILNSIASPEKAYSTTDPTALSGIFATIAADIMAAMRNASVNDPMGTGFHVTAGFATNLVPSQGTATYDQANKRISWTIGDLTTPTPNEDDDPNLKYAELVYHVEINDDILNAVSVDGNYKTNAGASVTYTDVKGNVVTSNFPEPTAKPLIIEMKKVLLDAGGNVVPDTFSNPRLFNFNVTLAGEATYNKNYPTGGNMGRVMTDIRIDGTYTLTEDITGSPLTNLSDYDTTINWTTYDGTRSGTQVVGTTYAGFEVPKDGANEPLNTRFTFTNKEKALGKLTIYKVVNNMPTGNKSMARSAASEFTVTVVGTNIYNPAEEIYNKTHTLTTAAPIVLENLQYGEYTITETVTNGFTPSYNDSQGVTTDGKVKLSIDSKEHKVTVTNTPDPDTAYVDVDAKKIWVGGLEADHVAVQIALYQDGEIYTATPTVTPNTGTANEFNYKWTGLPKYNKNGAEAEYTVKEVDVHPYYNVTQVGNTITNTYDAELAPFTVNANKDWSGGGTTKPNVWFTLYRKVGETGTEEIVTVDNDNATVPSTKIVVNNTVSWDNMPRYEGTDNTQTYIYFVKETDADGADFTPLNYTKSENGLRVLNTYNSPLIDVEGKKVWVGGVAEKPTIWLSLYRKVGTGTGEAVVVAGNPLRAELTSGNLSHTWKDLPKTDVNGTDYTYYVLETDADGADWKPDNYSKVESDLTVTNYYKSPANGKLEVTKIWEGDYRVTRPKMEFTLWRTLNVSDEGAVASTDKRLVDGDNTTAKWENLVEYNEDGAKYIYYVKEAFVEDKITNDNWVLGKYNFDDNSITNRVVKNYDDDTPDEKLGKLDIEKKFINEPQAAKGIQLMAATPIEFTVVVTDEYGIETSVQIKAGETKNLTELYYGEYTIKETVTHGYTPSYAPEKVTVKKDATTIPKFVVTNTNKDDSTTDPTTVNITITKEWVNGPKPGATLELWRKGVKVDGTAIDEKVGDSFNATATDLSKTYEKLAKHDPSGREFEYYAKEPIVPTNYTSAYKKVGDVEDKLTIINTFVVPTDGTLTFTKVWEGDNQVTRPTMVIELWRKVGTVEEAVVGADKKEVDATTTTATWTGLEKTNAAGDAYTFFVKETFKVEKESNNNWILGEYDFTNNSITNRVVKNYDDDTPDEKLGKLDIEKVFLNEPQAAKGVQLMAAAPIKFTVVVTDEYGIETPVQIRAGETKNLTELYYGEYTIKETVTHGYTPSYAPEKVTVKKDATTIPKFVVTNTNKDDSTTDPTTVNITITKEWVNGPKPGATLELWRKGVKVDGTAIDEKVGDSFNATATDLSKTYEKLAKHDPSGREFEYYAKEPIVPTNYTSAYKKVDDVEDKLTIINTFVVPTDGTLTFTKVWEGDNQVTRPTMVIELWRKVGTVEEAVVGADKKEVDATTTTATWTGLEKTNAAGDAYTFFVKETFKVEKESNNNWILGEYDFTNNSITNRVVKNYDDDTPDEKLGKLDIEKVFLNEPQAAKGVQLMAATPIEFTVVVTDEYGIETSVQIKAGETKNLTELYYGEYTIEETVTHGYTPSYAPEKVTVKKDAEEVPKFVVTNTNKDDSTTDPTTVNITITKEWVNGPKPDTVIELWRKGVDLEGNAIDEAVVNASFTANATKLSETFYDLAKHDPSGREFEYYAKEPTTPANYEQAYRSIPGVEGAEATLDLLTIVNTYKAPTDVSVTGRKLWLGGGATPIQIQLKQNGVPFGAAVTFGIGKTSHTWTNLPKADANGRDYRYTIDEVRVPDGYIKEVSNDGLTITNTWVMNDIIWGGGGYPALIRDDHFAYVEGYPDGGFRPDSEITRAEVAAIFARLMVEKMRVGETYFSNYSDVYQSAWYYNYIGYLTRHNILNGYPDGTFRPDNPITRAEFSKVASMFDKIAGGGSNFFDVPVDHWAKRYIDSAYNKGWVRGYPDGSFRPERYLSRAETVTVINRMLERYADEAFVLAHQSTVKYYNDGTRNHWAYLEIMEASNSHDYERVANNRERWLRLRPIE